MQTATSTKTPLMKTLTHRLIFPLFILLAFTMPASAIETVDEAIVIAGSQRMLTQRMLKDYAFAGIDIRARKARQDLEKSSALFDMQLKQLKDFATSPNISEQLAVVQKLWDSVKGVYYAEPSHKQLPNLGNNTELLLQACHQVVMLLESKNDSGKGKLLNLATQEQMLSQRIIGLSALKAWDFKDLHDTEYQKAIQTFDEGLQALNSNADNSTEIVAGLTKVKEQFKRFISTLSVSKGDYSLAIASVSAEKIAQQMEAIIQQYQQLKAND